MTEHLLPVSSSSSCCQCACGGIESMARDRGFGSLLDSLMSRPSAQASRASGPGSGVGDWFGFLDPLSNFQLKQVLQELRASQEIERRVREQVQEARKEGPGAPNRFADQADPAGVAAPARPSGGGGSAAPPRPLKTPNVKPSAGRPATPAQPAEPATPAQPGTPAHPAEPATPAQPAAPAQPATPAQPSRDDDHAPAATRAQTPLEGQGRGRVKQPKGAQSCGCA